MSQLTKGLPGWKAGWRGPLARLIIGLLTGVVVLGLALQSVPLADLFEHAAPGLFGGGEGTGGTAVGWFGWNRNGGALVAALVVIVTNTLLKVLRWKLLLDAGARLEAGEAGMTKALPSPTHAHPQQKTFPYLWLARLFMAGQLLNLAVPGRLGDVGRILLAGGRTSENKDGAVPPAHHRSLALGTVVVEKLVDLVVYGLLAAGVLAWLGFAAAPGLPGWALDSTLGLALLGGGALGGLVLLVWQRRLALSFLTQVAYRLPARFQPALIPRLRAGIGALAALSNRADLAWLVCLTAGVWATAVLTNALVLRAVGLQVPLAAPFLILVLLQAGISIYAVPGHLGIFEFACMLALGVFGVAAAPALGFALLLHALLAGWTTGVELCAS